MRFKRHYPLLILLVLVISILLAGLGTQRIIAYTRPGSAVVVQSGAAFTTNVALFDQSIVHSIQILISAADYQAMLTTYKQTGEKDYYHADVIIDGVQISDVGLRLKGNASLRTAVGGGRPGGPGGGPGQPGRPGRQPGDAPQPGGDVQNRQDPPQPGAPGQPAQNTSSAQTASVKIPLMIKFNEFVSGQNYQGYTSLAIRTYGTTQNAALLEEPLTNAAFRLVGLPAPQTAYIGLKINDGAEQLYTIAEVINQGYIDRTFPASEGVLYKAEVGASLAYLGEDPSAYSGKFTLQTHKNEADLGPLIAFSKFIDQSDDATFEAQLPNYLDVDAFAMYLAINNLLVNNDSLVGMNNNYYLYYHQDTRRFTLLYWDGNESLSKMARGGQGANFDIYYTSDSGPRMGGRRSALVTRFLASPTYKALYEQKLKQFYQAAFLSGALQTQVDQIDSTVHAALPARPSLTETQAYDQAVASVQDFLTRRAAYLATTPLLK
jgi:spore coat protein CotH